MRKTIITLLAVLLTATAAQAEHKLLITDVLDQKQVEAEATFEYAHASRDFSTATVSAKQTLNAIESTYSLGVGVGHGVEVTAFVPYVFRERVKSEVTSVAPSRNLGGGLEPEYEKREGFGDFQIEGKYRLLGGEEELFTVVTGLNLKFDTASTEDFGPAPRT